MIDANVRDDEISLVTISAASRITGISRDTLRLQMELWDTSGHRIGLRWLRIADRRLIRRSALREWMESLERTA